MAIEIRLVAANGVEIMNGVLSDATGKSVSPIYCDAGVVSFSYPKVGRNYDKIKDLKKFEVAIYVNGVKQPKLGATMYTSDTDDVAEAPLVKYEGNMLLQLLDGMVAFPNGWPNYDKLDPSKKVVNATAGAIIKTFIAESQARGTRTEITTSSFTGTTDSNGVAWNKQISLEITPGVSVTDLLKSLHGNYMCEFEMVGRDLRMYNMDTMTTERTTGLTPVVFRKGRDLTDSPRKQTSRDLITVMLAGGKDDAGVYHQEIDAAAVAEHGRIEGFVSNGNITDPGTLEAYSEAELAQVSQPKMEKTHGLTFVDPRSPLPTRDFNVGDWTLSDVGGGLERYRVKQWVLTEDADGTMNGSVVLNDLFAEVQERLVRRVNGIIGGTTVSGASKAVERVPTDLVDGVAPKVPVALSLSSAAYTQASGQSWAQVTATWSQVTQNTDGTILEDLEGYELRWRPQTAAGGTRSPVTYDYAQENNTTYNANWDKLLAEGWRGVAGDNVERIYPPEYFDGFWRVVPAGNVATMSWSPLQPGIPIQVQIRSYDKIGNTAGWSASVAILTASDTVAPPVPAAPVADNYLGLIRIVVSGKFVNNVRAPGDFEVFRLHVSDVANFTPTPANRVENFSLAGGSHFIKAPYGEVRYAKLVAIDFNGNESAASAQASSSATKLLGDDIFAGAVGTAALAALAVKRANIDDLAVNSAKIADLDVGKLTAGIISAQMTLTGRLATALTGQRTELNGLGLYGYTAAEALSFRFDGVNNLLTGTFQTALTGRRIVQASGGTAGQTLYHAPDGRYGRIISYTEGTGLEATRFEGAGRDAAGGALSYYNLNSDNYTSSRSYKYEHVGKDFWRVLLSNSNDYAAPSERYAINLDGSHIWRNQSAGAVMALYQANGWELYHNTVAGYGLKYNRDGQGHFELYTADRGRMQIFTGPGGDQSPLLRFFNVQGYGLALRAAMASTYQNLDVVNSDNNVWYSVRASQFLAQSDGEVKSAPLTVSRGDMLEDVLSMRVRRYHRRNAGDYGYDLQEREEIGFITQESPDRVVYEGSDSSFIDTYQVLALAVGAIQALHRDFNDYKETHP